jgi:hypothetical protein
MQRSVPAAGEPTMRDTIHPISLLAVLVLCTTPLNAQTRQGQVNAELASLNDVGVKACSLLTNAEIREVTGRDKPYELNEDPYDQNSLCDYSGIVTIRVFAGEKGQAAIDGLLKNYQVNDGRMPISGFGDGAFLMYPTPRDQYADTVALLVGRAGATMFMITLSAPGDDTAESVKPALLELARTVMARLQ